MSRLRVWWVARRVARRELDELLSDIDTVLGGHLDDAEWDTDTDQSWVYGLDLLDEM